MRAFPNVAPSIEPKPINWRKALLAASAIDATAPSDLLELRLLICSEALQNGDAPANARRAATVLLQRGGNQRALDLALARGLLKAEDLDLPLNAVGFDAVKSSLHHTIPTSDGRLITANEFQASFWDAAQSARWVSASAPTSAGKSFIVRELLKDRLADGATYTAALVVPTRALVEEISRDLETDLGNSAMVITLPWAEANEAPAKVYVMTQERLHALQQLDSNLHLDLLFIDEAQNIAFGRRGVLLRRVIEETRRRSPDVNVLFASPTTENPEILLRGGPDSAAAVQSSGSAVDQNLVFVNQVPYHPEQWRVSAFYRETRIDIGLIGLPARPSTVSKRLPLVALALGSDSSSNIVYADGASDAEKIALQLANGLGQKLEPPQDLLDIKELSEKTIHPEYALADCILSGVAFHYGNMPIILRESIEAAFRKGSIQYLVCTSTLLEGVNLPCQNIFIRGPHKGAQSPMSESDFWNLAGRAGRWGREFQGNIVCIDTERPKVWSVVPSAKKLQRITFATDVAGNDIEQFISAVKGNEVEPDEILESVVSLAIAARSTGEKIELSAWFGLDAVERKLVANELDTRLSGLQIPTLLVSRHAGVSPRRMENLFAALRERRDLESLDLVLPESLEASARLSQALGFVGAFLGGTIGTHVGRHTQLAILLVQWMRGVPLAALVAARVNYVRRRDGDRANIPGTIRSVMADIEQIARFEAPLLLGAYRDILATARDGSPLEVTGRNSSDYVAMLELGVSRMTEFSMLSMGISRTSAVALSDYLTADNMSPSDVESWLADSRIDSLSVPALVRQELKAFVTRKLPAAGSED